MLTSTDPIGFPLVCLPRQDIEVHLLPVTRVQVRQWLTDAPSALPEEHRKSLEPDAEVSPENREHLFATGLLPRECIAFAQWLSLKDSNGDWQYDLLTVGEWRDLFLRFSYEPFDWDEVRRFLIARNRVSSGCCHEEAMTILDRLNDQIHPVTALDVSLMRNGLVEWVREGDEFVGLGNPRQLLHPNLWNPLCDEVRPISMEERILYFGLRLVRRMR